MDIFEYVNTTLAKGSIGAYVSVGLIGLACLTLVLGVLFGAKRGFSKSVIRIFTVGASAVCSLYSVKWICKMIVDRADKIAGEGKSLADVMDAYPDIASSIPETVRSVTGEIDAQRATIVLMMIVALVVSPLLFIVIFQIFKALSFLVYSLLSGLTGAISYGKGPISTILGAAVGLVQGALIAVVMIFPISGLCDVAMEVREPLINEAKEPNQYIAQAYDTVFDDLADNPLFNVVDNLGGEALYRDMITFKINGEKMYMGDRCVGAVKVVSDIVPIATGGFDWKHPTEDQRASIDTTLSDIGDDELIAGLTADIMRGVSKSVQNGKLKFPVSGGAFDTIVDDVMTMFSTTNEQTIEGDLDAVIDVYFIMCDNNLMDSFASGAHTDMKALLTTKNAEGKTVATLITDRLNAYDRTVPIVTSFTKISLSVMHGSQQFDEKTEQLYESVKVGVTDALTHNKSDFETEEEYKAAVEEDLDKALSENNINVSDSVKKDMVEYIANNYGDYTGEITDKEVNDALLSYYESYAKNQQNGGSTEGGSTEGGSTEGGSTEGGSTEGGSTEGGSTEGGSTEGGSTEGGENE